MLYFCSLPNQVTVFSANSSTGAFTSPQSFSVEASPEGVAYSPDGNFLAVAKTQGDSISVYSVNSITGVLTSISGSPVSINLPLPVAFSPNSKFIATGYVSDNAVFILRILQAIEPNTTGLTQSSLTMALLAKFGASTIE